MDRKLQAFITCCACFVLSGGGCSSEDNDQEPASKRVASSEKATAYLGLAKPTDGFQIRSVGAEIGPGEDLEFCEVGRLPGDPDTTYIAKSFELGNETGSHHLIGLCCVDRSKCDEELCRS